MPWYFYNNRGVLKQDGLPDPMPVGLITAFVTNIVGVPVPPTGWLLCNGAVVATALYPDLAAKLAFPAAPGVNFTLPNFDTTFAIGAGSKPLKSSSVSPAYSSHTHGGLSASHTHSNSHTHAIGNHSHTYTHQHDSGHNHGNGTLVAAATTSGENATRTSDLADATPVPISKGSGSGDSHTHGVTGSTGASETNEMLVKFTPATGLSGADVTSSGHAIVSNPAQATISNSGSILPPYLNVYYIIKAVDYSGTYI